ncbi:MAG TPA: LamG domain-containing protein, partial [Flavisolibacter sp.]|nr:LamG domain-containing protein [Flavisolibacter sp.]
ILSKGDGSNTALTNYIFNVGGNTNNSRLGIYAGGAWYSATTVLNTGIWYHAAVTVSGTAVTFYLNGVNDGTATLSSSLYTGGAYSFKIGEQGDACNCNYMNGRIDEVRVWNTERTATEIKTNLFNKNLSNSASGLVAYYRFNEGSGTSVGNSGTNTTGIGGTLNGAAWVASPVQFAANELKFNGSTNYVELANRINIGSSDFTFEAWVKPAGMATGMVFAQDVCGDGEHQFRLYTNNSRVNFDLSDAASLGAAYSFQLPSTVNSVPLNTWTHIAVVRRLNDYYLYINGVQNATISTGANTINNQSGADVNKRLRIGARGGVATGCGLNYFNGSLDDLRYWNVARTATEIQQAYLKEVAPALNSNLVAYYTFNQGVASGTNTGLRTLIDQKGVNNGTLTNFALTGATSNFIAQGSSLVVLPLKWDSFTAQSQGNNVLLKWRTSSELNTKNFVVQRSIDGRLWSDIGQVAAAGSSYTIKEYSYTDVHPVEGINFYRILQTDIDGRSSYSNIRTATITAPFKSFVVLNN